MKIKLLLASFLLISYLANSQETSIPDANFEAFLEANGMGNGIAEDNLVTTANIENVTTLNVDDQGVANITGIEGFVSLETLIFFDNGITNIDVSANTNLTALVVSGDNELTQIITGTNSNITSLQCPSNPKLTNVDVSGLESLSSFSAANSGLTMLDFSNNPVLTFLHLDGNSLTALDLSTNAVLKELQVNNNNLSTLNVKNGNTAGLTFLKASGNPNLSCIKVDDVTSSHLNSWTKDDDAFYGEHCYETEIPDANFENYLETHDADGNSVPLNDPTSMGNGIANDNHVTTSKINTVTTLSVIFKSIKNLTGIEDFTALEELNCQFNDLENLDLSNNLALTTLSALTNDLTSLDLSNNSNLVTLLVTGNDLTYLNVANGNNGNITSFNAQSNPDLTCINVDDETNPDLEDWFKDASASFSEHCNDTYVPDDNFEQALINAGYDTGTLDDYVPTANIAAITSFVITIAPPPPGQVTDPATLITDMKGLEDFTALVTLNISGQKVTSLNIVENINLENLYVDDNELVSLDIGPNNQLAKVSIANNNMIEIETQLMGSELLELNCGGNPITNLDVTGNGSLKKLDTHGTSITSLDLSANPFLIELSIYDGMFSDIDLSKNLALIKLYAYNNTLSSLDLSINVELDRLEVNNNSLTSIDLTANTKIINLDLSNNLLTDLDFSNHAKLKTLRVFGNALTALNVKNGNSNGMSIFHAYGNPDLYCIQVEDDSYAGVNWIKDTHATYSETACNTITIAPKVFLQGAFLNPNTGEETLMRDDLRVAGYIDTQSPYNLDATSAEVLAVTGDNAIVDWIFIALRDANDNTLVITDTSALLQRDGDIVGFDGVSPIGINIPWGAYNVSVKHRNHLSIITAATVNLTGTTTTVDFTTDSTVTLGGTNAVVDMGNGTFAMFGGDYDENGQVQNSDINSVILELGASGYSKADMDMNGQIQNTDINNLLNGNIGKGEQF